MAPSIAWDEQPDGHDYPAAASYLSLIAMLLVRGALDKGLPLQIADGYHRVCASYHLGENSVVPCRIADLPTA